MTIYIIDTNLVFSAILNTSSSIAEFIVNADANDIQLKAPTYLKGEFVKHMERLERLTGKEATTLLVTLNEYYGLIDFVPDQDIPIVHFAKAYKLIGHIDSDDLSFVALSSLEDKYLLTEDKKLAKGLISKGYQKVITFQQLKEKHNIK